MSKLLVRQYEIGPYQNFLYLLGDPATKEMAVVDPAWDADFLCEEAQKLGYQITKVFLTHAHPDHVNGLDCLLSRHDVPVYISKYEAPFLRPTSKQLVDVTPKDKLSVGGIDFQIIHAPGHTPGCQCFLAQGQMICGDVLFVDGCGRCDLPGGDAKIMYDTLYNVIIKLPDNIVIYPGHNYGASPTDTLGHQKQTNPYLQCRSLQEFLGERMGV